MHRGTRSYNCGRRLDAGHHISARAAIGEWLWDTSRAVTTRQSSIVTPLLMVMPHTRSFYPHMMPTCFIIRTARAFQNMYYHGYTSSGQLIRYTPRWKMRGDDTCNRVRTSMSDGPDPRDGPWSKNLSMYNMTIAPGPRRLCRCIARV